MQNRTLWIIVVLLVVGMILCCCVAAGVAGVVTYLTAVPTVSEGGIGRVEERTEQTFDVGEAPFVEVDSFAGNVRVSAAVEGEIRVTVTKRAGTSAQMEQISVDIAETQDGIRIDASAPGSVTGYRTVDVELVVPSDTHLWLNTGAGSVEIDGVIGDIEAHTGAGNIDVEDATGPVNLDTGAGEIDYAGEPRGTCTFSTGAGNVMLRLPGDLDAELELHTGIGDIELGGFDVDGNITEMEVDGVIGSGEGAFIEARTGVGNIGLDQR